MLKGLAITPPVIGRISIGRVVEKNNRRLPEKDDEFTLTSQVQGHEGWVKHPLDAALRKDGGKLRNIPVRLVFGEPELNLRASFTLFDRATGRPACVGDGENCKRLTRNGIEALPCPTPAACALGQDGRCKPYGRLHVRVMTDTEEEDGLSTFIFRTTGFNSIRTISARLSYFKAVSKGMLAEIPLVLRLRGKSTTQSHRAPIYYVDLTVPQGVSLEDAVEQAGRERERRKQMGFDQDALDQAARDGYAAGAFEESEEEGAAVVEEFFPDGNQGDPPAQAPQGVQAKLEQRLQRTREQVS
jgi:hypothetical protein